jgi:hypothetical protein
MSAEEQARNALKQIDNHENELRELRRDIHALATIEIYHAAGAVVPTQRPATPLTTDQVNEYNSSVQRLNDRYGHQRRR